MNGYIGSRAKRKRRNTYFFFFIVLILTLIFLYYNSINNNLVFEGFENDEDINVKIEKKDNQITLQKQKIRNLENKISFLNLDNNSLKKKLEDLIFQIEKKNSDNIEKKNIDENKIIIFKDKINELENLIKKIEKEKIDSLSSNSDLENEYNLLEIRLKEMSKELINLKTQNNLFKEEAIELKKINISQQKIIEKFEDASHH